MIKKFFVLVVLLMFFSVSDSYAMSDSVKTLQTHVFKTSNKKLVEDAVISVLYDNDFIIEDFDTDIGFIRAQKIFKQHYVNKGRVAFNSLYLGAMAAYTVFSYGSTAASMYDPGVKIKNELHHKTAVVDVNVNIEQFGNNKVRVRFVPVKKILQNADGYSFMRPAVIKVIRLQDKELYDEFFNQIEGFIKCNI